MRVEGFYNSADEIDHTKVELVIKSEMYDQVLRKKFLEIPAEIPFNF